MPDPEFRLQLTGVDISYVCDSVADTGARPGMTWPTIKVGV